MLGGWMAGFRSMPKSFDPLVQLFILRLLITMDGYRFMWDDRRVTEPSILRSAGVPVPEDAPGFEPKVILASLRTQLATMEKMAPKSPRTATLTKNVAWLAKMLGLDAVEADIVLFLGLAHHANVLNRVLEKFGQLRTHQIHELISTATGHPFEKVSQALRHTSRLIRSSLVWSDMRNQWAFDNKAGLLAGVADQLALDHKDQAAIFQSNYIRSGPPTLSLEDFPHLTGDLQILEGYLGQALAAHKIGVNVLLYGQPGTGKTELARCLAMRLGAPLFEIAVEDRDGIVHKGDARLGAFQLAQGVLGGSPCPLILFDEIEDVFKAEDRDGFGRHRNQGGRKGWINRLLAQVSDPHGLIEL